MQTPVDADRRAAALAAVPVTLITLGLAWAWRGYTHPDLDIARRAAAVLFSARPFEVYAREPLAQMGPAAIAASVLPHPVYNVLVAALVGPFVYLAGLQSSVGRGASRGRVALWAVTASALALPWSQLAWKAHADDALVLLGAALMLDGLRRGSRAQSVAGFACAAVGKPTALALFPLLLESGPVLVAGVLTLLLVWGPFAAADLPALLRAGRGVMPVVPGDTVHYLSVRVGPPPVWMRPVQLVLALASTAFGLLRRAPAVGLLLALTLKALLEPNPAPAYCISLVAIALFVDARRSLPTATGLALTSFVMSQRALDIGAGMPRLVALLALAAWCVLALLEVSVAIPALVRGRARRLVATGAVVGLAISLTAGPSQARNLLKQGYRGDGVRCAQLALNEILGSDPFAGTPIAVDGRFGPATIRATAQLQSYALAGTPGPIDGWVGPATAEILRAGLSDSPPDWHCDRALPRDARIGPEVGPWGLHQTGINQRATLRAARAAPPA
ncbi:MAG: peptidoglycan-binding protein [Micrococcales bacterium]|nr:peptidoglycan-binding protein [Micrococcales bacterium]